MSLLPFAVECDSSFFNEALPFFFGIGFVLLAPILDDLLWRSRYIKFYEDNDYSIVTPKELAEGASWAVDLAQVFPAVLLTEAGVILTFDHVSGAAAAAVLGTAAAPLALIAWIQRRGNLHAREKDPRLLGYSLPQVAVALINLAAIIILAF